MDHPQTKSYENEVTARLFRMLMSKTGCLKKTVELGMNDLHETKTTGKSMDEKKM